MSLPLLLNSEVLDVYHDEDNAWLYLDWKGPQEVERVQAACRHITTFLAKLGIRKALNDNTHITQTSWELVKWVAYDYLPEAGQAGLDYVAWVQSPSPSCRAHVDLMGYFVGQKPHVAIFSDMAAAYAWLSSVAVLEPANQQSGQHH
ncbi:hypothetical protein [Hymenobacter terricola]|uniref:hypothetical protein n=1 Tax=Hymenobacter terricola TaxID=2819236 RepID=UPI001B318815|nr:hypothetical protein [Hymenobacter terricola]